MSYFEKGSTPGPITRYGGENPLEIVVSRQIDLPTTAYHHHDVESLSDVSTIYRELTNDKLTPSGTCTRPQLNRKLTGRTYPEGGLRAWSVVLGSFSGMMASFGFMATSKFIQITLEYHH